MSAETYAEFLTRMGHRVVRTSTTWWFNSTPGIYWHFPFNQCITPDRSEIDELLGLTGLAVRYSCPSTSGRPCNWYVIDRPGYDLDRLSTNTRSKIRRGLKRCDVRQLDFAELEPLGAMALSRETLARQSRSVPRNHDTFWRRHFQTAGTTETFETWGAFVDGQLAAFLIACNIDGCLQIFVVRSRRSLLSHYPNNALLFVTCQQALERTDIHEVSYGWESLRGQLSGLDTFKDAMGFTKRPAGQRFEFHRWMQPMVNLSLAAGLRKITQHQRHRANPGRLAGMVECLQT